MYDYTVKYGKNGIGQYISHLDFLRTIGRSMRRAGLLPVYSQGFNPHPVISFVSPLAVGITSECEYFTVQLQQKVPVSEFVERLNGALPECIRVFDAIEGKFDFSGIIAADYIVTVENPVSQSAIDAFLAEKEIIITKKTKRALKETDIKKDIFNILVNDNTVTLTIAAGGQGSLKPMQVMGAVSAYGKADLGFCKYHRVCFRSADGIIVLHNSC